jgi:hypothetical protein
VDPSGDGGPGLTTTGLICGSCGAQSSPRDFSDLAEELLVALAGELRAARQFLQQH